MAPPIVPLTHERLLQSLHYDPATGAFTWTVRAGAHVHPGDLAGSVHAGGYRTIRILSRHYMASHLAWFYVHGTWPTGKLAHVNGITLDDSIGNLRDMSHDVARRNQPRPAFVRPLVDEKTYIEARVERITESGCWIWMGNIRSSSHEYGVANINGARYAAHRFSWLTFRGPIPQGMLLCHRCDIPQCVNPNHLFIGTHKDNSCDAASKKRTAWGVRNFTNKLSEEQVQAIRADPRPQRTVAKAFGVSKSTIAFIRRGEAWEHLPPIPNAGPAHRVRTNRERGERNPRAKLTEDQVKQIRNDPRSQSKIAKTFGVSQKLISLIKRRSIWGHI